MSEHVSQFSVAESEGSAPLIPELTIVHNPEPVPSTCSQPLFLNILMLSSQFSKLMFPKRFPVEFYCFNIKEEDEGRGSEMSIQIASKICTAILANHFDSHDYHTY